jgi:hypothetical protein
MNSTFNLTVKVHRVPMAARMAEVADAINIDFF